ncbi:MAG: hypothetical protein RLZZ519_2532 [Bacteroidota bacterium]
MPKSADADDRDLVPMAHVVISKRGINGNATAEQWRSIFWCKRCWNRECKTGIDKQMVRKASITAIASCEALTAKLFLTFETPFAISATTCLPADSNNLAQLEPRYLVTQFNHGADRFMAGNKWIFTCPPVVVDQVHVTVANPAMREFDKYFASLRRV